MHAPDGVDIAYEVCGDPPGGRSLSCSCTVGPATGLGRPTNSATPRIGDDFVGWTPPTGGDETLGIVDFSIFPHVDNEDLPWNTMANAERWAGGLSGPAYAINDETAIKVVDGTVDVVSEGHWRLLTP